MDIQGPDSEAVSKWLTSIFKAPENRDKLKIKDVAVSFGQRFDRRSPASLISKVMKGKREIKLEELVFFEELFGDRFPPPWALRGEKSSDPVAYSSFAEDQAAWVDAPLTTNSAQPTALYMIPVFSAEAAPAYRIGNKIWVDPGRPVKAKDDVYIELIDRKTREKIKLGIIRECLEVHPDYFIFALWAAGTEEKHDRQNIAVVHPIVSVTR